MRRVDALAFIRRAGYLGNFKSMLEIRIKNRISHEVAMKEFNIGFEIKENEELNFNGKFDAGVLNNE